MNTSMTINATAGLAARPLRRQRRGPRASTPACCRARPRTTSSRSTCRRGTYIFPPGPSRRLTVDTIAYTVRHVPKWNPINVCSYHLQEAGATPVQEMAYALATAIGVLDAVRDVGPDRRRRVPRRWSAASRFFVNAGVRFVEETCKMRAFTELWDRICAERYGVDDPKLRRFRYGVQVNSLGPHRGAAREQRAAHRPRGARRHPVQAGPGPGPAAPGLERGPRPAPPLGPAVVAAHPADPGLRVRPARVRRHLRRLAWSSRPRRPSWPRRRGPSWTTCWPWAGPSRPSTS